MLLSLADTEVEAVRADVKFAPVSAQVKGHTCLQMRRGGL